jgi:hypothetical protein
MPETLFRNGNASLPMLSERTQRECGPIIRKHSERCRDNSTCAERITCSAAAIWVKKEKQAVISDYKKQHSGNSRTAGLPIFA